ncbi:MAG: DUF5658 family protein [Vicinamibacterales bacterium]
MVRNRIGRYARFTLVFTLAMGAQAYAADAPLTAVTAPTFARVAFAAADAARGDEKAVDQPLPARRAPATVAIGRRPKPLPALYASLAALNALDALTTARGLQHGAVEANPLMKGVVGNTPAMFAVKAASTAVSIWMAERLWKKRNRAAAIATMVAVNAVTGIVVMHNQAVINRVR